MTGIGTDMAKGAAWMVGFKLLDKAIGLISTIFLARLLIPEDFGIVAMATSVIAVIELLQAFSFDVVLIQRQDATRDDYDTAWTLNALLGGLCSMLLLVASPLAAWFYGDARVAPVLMFLAFIPLLTGLENIGVVAFRKDLQLHKDFWLQLARRLSVFTVTLAAAFTLKSYWALVIGMLAGRALAVGFTYVAHPFRPRFCLASRRSLFQFSKWLLVNNAIVVANMRAADFFVGRAGGPTELGTFSLALELSNIPTTELSAPINRATFPGYSRIAAATGALRDHFLKVLSMIALITVPAACGVAAVADSLVPVLLGPKWIEAIPLMKVLAAYGLLMSLLSNGGSLYLALGRPRLITAVAGTHALLMLALLAIGTAKAGALGAAWALVATVTLMLPINFLAIRSVLRITLTQIMQIVWRPFLASAAMYGIVATWLELRLEQYGSASVVTLTSAVLIGAISYAVIAILLWLACGRPTGAESFIVTRANQFVRSVQ